MSTILEQTALRIAIRDVAVNLDIDDPNGKWFDITKVDTLAHVIFGNSDHLLLEDYRFLRVLHCVNWDEFTEKEIKAVRKTVCSITGIKF